MPEYFSLQEGERIIKEIKPLSKLKWYFLFGGVQVSGVIIFFFAIFFTSMFALVAEYLNFQRLTLVATILGILLVFVINIFWASLKYNKQFYWITSKRIIYKRGIIGYQITSIPFERVSDVIISRTFIERLFGFGSLHIQSLAGQITGSKIGSEAALLAIPEPEKTQELIFQLTKEKRKRERLTF